MKNTDNKLIAEFMGYKVVYKPKVVNGENFFEYIDENGKYTYCNSLLRYNGSWDWLMPVVEKYYNELEHIEDDDFFWRSRLHEQLLDINLAGTYQAVIDFIAYHNYEKP